MTRTNIEQKDGALKVFATILAAFGLIFFYGFQIDAQAHSGGLNSQGCHAGSKPYHCHRSSSEMVTFRAPDRMPRSRVGLMCLRMLNNRVGRKAV